MLGQNQINALKTSIDKIGPLFAAGTSKIELAKIVLQMEQTAALGQIEAELSSIRQQIAENGSQIDSSLRERGV